jgi:hypothetical protein
LAHAGYDFHHYQPEHYGRHACVCGHARVGRILFEYIETGDKLAEFLDAFPSASRELAQGVLQEAKQSVVHAHSA